MTNHVIPMAFQLNGMFLEFNEKVKCCASCHRKQDSAFDCFIDFGTLEYKKISYESEKASSAEHKRDSLIELKKNPSKYQEFRKVDNLYYANHRRKNRGAWA